MAKKTNSLNHETSPGDQDNPKKRSVKTLVKLKDSIKVSGGDTKDHLHVVVTNPSLNVNLVKNKRPKDEFTLQDFFGKIRNLSGVHKEV
jgi:hypothetical protein